MRTVKKCTKCFEVKDLTEFRRQSSTKDGYKFMCKWCDSLIQKARYQTKKQNCLTKVKDWQNENNQKVKEYKKNWKNKTSKKSSS